MSGGHPYLYPRALRFTDTYPQMMEGTWTGLLVLWDPREEDITIESEGRTMRPFSVCSERRHKYLYVTLSEKRMQVMLVATLGGERHFFTLKQNAPLIIFSQRDRYVDMLGDRAFLSSGVGLTIAREYDIYLESINPNYSPLALALTDKLREGGTVELLKFMLNMSVDSLLSLKQTGLINSQFPVIYGDFVKRDHTILINVMPLLLYMADRNEIDFRYVEEYRKLVTNEELYNISINLINLSTTIKSYEIGKLVYDAVKRYFRIYQDMDVYIKLIEIMQDSCVVTEVLSDLDPASVNLYRLPIRAKKIIGDNVELFKKFKEYLISHSSISSLGDEGFSDSPFFKIYILLERMKGREVTDFSRALKYIHGGKQQQQDPNDYLERCIPKFINNSRYYDALKQYLEFIEDSKEMNMVHTKYMKTFKEILSQPEILGSVIQNWYYPFSESSKKEIQEMILYYIDTEYQVHAGEERYIDYYAQVRRGCKSTPIIFYQLYMPILDLRITTPTNTLDLTQFEQETISPIVHIVEKIYKGSKVTDIESCPFLGKLERCSRHIFNLLKENKLKRNAYDYFKNESKEIQALLRLDRLRGEAEIINLTRNLDGIYNNIRLMEEFVNDYQLNDVQVTYFKTEQFSYIVENNYEKILSFFTINEVRQMCTLIVKYFANIKSNQYLNGDFSIMMKKHLQQTTKVFKDIHNSSLKLHLYLEYSEHSKLEQDAELFYSESIANIKRNNLMLERVKLMDNYIELLSNLEITDTDDFLATREHILNGENTLTSFFKYYENLTSPLHTKSIKIDKVFEILRFFINNKFIVKIVDLEKVAKYQIAEIKRNLGFDISKDSVLKGIIVLEKLKNVLADLVAYRGKDFKTFCSCFCEWCKHVYESEQSVSEVRNDFSLLDNSIEEIYDLYDRINKNKIELNYEKIRLIIAPTANISFLPEKRYYIETGKGNGNKYCERDITDLKVTCNLMVDVNDSEIKQVFNCFEKIIGQIELLSVLVDSGLQMGVPYLHKRKSLNQGCIFSTSVKLLEKAEKSLSNIVNNWKSSLNTIFKENGCWQLLPVPRYHLFSLVVGLVDADRLTSDAIQIISSLQLQDSRDSTYLGFERQIIESVNNKDESMGDENHYINYLKALCNYRLEPINNKITPKSFGVFYNVLSGREFVVYMKAVLSIVKGQTNYFHFLFCNKFTTVQNVNTFLECCQNCNFIIPDFNETLSTFYIINPNLLAEDSFTTLSDGVKEIIKRKTARLEVIQISGKETIHDFSSLIEKEYKTSEHKDDVLRHSRELVPKRMVEFVRSKYAGNGKTKYIKEEIKRNNLHDITVTIYDYTNLETIIRDLQKGSEGRQKGQKLAVHVILNLSYEKKPKLLPLLFSMIYLSHLYFNNTLFNLRDTSIIYIECREATYDVCEFFGMSAKDFKYDPNHIDCELGYVKNFITTFGNDASEYSPQTVIDIFHDICNLRRGNDKKYYERDTGKYLAFLNTVSNFKSFRVLRQYMEALILNNETLVRFSDILKDHSLKRKNRKSFSNESVITVLEINRSISYMKALMMSLLTYVLKYNNNILMMDELATLDRPKLIDGTISVLDKLVKAKLMLWINKQCYITMPISLDNEFDKLSPPVKVIILNHPSYNRSLENFAKADNDKKSAILFKELVFLMNNYDKYFQQKLIESQKNKTKFNSIIFQVFNFDKNDSLHYILNSDGCKFLEQYVFTVDNTHKMLSIYLRLINKVPAVLVGETGVGKTELILRMKNISGLRIEHIRIHAETPEEELVNFIEKGNNEAEHAPYYLFFDEANTSPLVQLIENVVTSRTLNGKQLNGGLGFIIAVNPYRKLKEGEKLLYKDFRNPNCELSEMAYTVYPLPIGLQDMAFNFDKLPESEYLEYARCILSETLSDNATKDKAISLIEKTVSFMNQNQVVISLRELNRVSKLIKFFRRNEYFFPRNEDPEVDKEEAMKAIQLSAYYVFASRFPNEMRGKYLQWIKDQLEYDLRDVYVEIRDKNVSGVPLPENIALNNSLKSNLFDIAVALHTRIPLIIIGKPGASKSLAVLLHERNNKENVGKNDYSICGLPLLDIVSYQGNKNSTSQGIEDAYRKASRIANEQDTLNDKERKLYDHITVFFFDEMGLAEQNGKKNSLKCLHYILEVKEHSSPKEIGESNNRPAFIGISNYALDLAKINRCLIVCRDDLDKDDLIKTADGIANSGENKLGDIIKHDVEKVIDGYIQCMKAQKEKEFDIYSLRNLYTVINDICYYTSGKTKASMNLVELIQKSFDVFVKDGVAFNPYLCFSHCTDNIRELNPQMELKMVKCNLAVNTNRHIMILIDNISQALSIMNKINKATILDNMGHQTHLIIPDTSDSFTDSSINEIITLMNPKCESEKNSQQIVFILKSDTIYPSLFGILNRNYIYYNGVYTVKVAFGAARNESSEISPNFRIICFMFPDDISKADPAFISRFEFRNMTTSQSIRLSEFDCSEYEEPLNYIRTLLGENVKAALPMISELSTKDPLIFNIIKYVRSKKGVVADFYDEIYGLLSPEYKMRMPTTSNSSNIPILKVLSSSLAFKYLSNAKQQDKLRTITIIFVDVYNNAADVGSYMCDTWHVYDKLFGSKENTGLLDRKRQENDVCVYVPPLTSNIDVYINAATFKFYMNHAKDEHLIIVARVDASIYDKLYIAPSSKIQYLSVSSDYINNPIYTQLYLNGDITQNINCFDYVLWDAFNVKWPRSLLIERKIFIENLHGAIKKGYFKGLVATVKDDQVLKQHTDVLSETTEKSQLISITHNVQKRLTEIMADFVDRFNQCGIIIWNTEDEELVLIDRIITSPDLISFVKSYKLNVTDKILLHSMYRHVLNQMVDDEEKKRIYDVLSSERLRRKCFVYEFILKYMNVEQPLYHNFAEKLKLHAGYTLYDNIYNIIKKVLNFETKTDEEIFKELQTPLVHDEDVELVSLILNILYITGFLNDEQKFEGVREDVINNLVKYCLTTRIPVLESNQAYVCNKIKLARLRYWGMYTHILAISKLPNLPSRIQECKSLVDLWGQISDNSARIVERTSYFIPEIIDNVIYNLPKLSVEIIRDFILTLIQMFNTLIKYFITHIDLRFNIQLLFKRLFKIADEIQLTSEQVPDEYAAYTDFKRILCDNIFDSSIPRNETTYKDDCIELVKSLTNSLFDVVGDNIEIKDTEVKGLIDYVFLELKEDELWENLNATKLFEFVKFKCWASAYFKEVTDNMERGADLFKLIPEDIVTSKGYMYKFLQLQICFMMDSPIIAANLLKMERWRQANIPHIKALQFANLKAITFGSLQKDLFNLEAKSNFMEKVMTHPDECDLDNRDDMLAMISLGLNLRIRGIFNKAVVDNFDKLKKRILATKPLGGYMEHVFKALNSIPEVNSTSEYEEDEIYIDMIILLAGVLCSLHYTPSSFLSVVCPLQESDRTKLDNMFFPFPPPSSSAKRIKEDGGSFTGIVICGGDLTQKDAPNCCKEVIVPPNAHVCTYILAEIFNNCGDPSDGDHQHLKCPVCEKEGSIRSHAADNFVIFSNYRKNKQAGYNLITKCSELAPGLFTLPQCDRPTDLLAYYTTEVALVTLLIQYALFAIVPDRKGIEPKTLRCDMKIFISALAELLSMHKLIANPSKADVVLLVAHYAEEIIKVFSKTAIPKEPEVRDELEKSLDNVLYNITNSIAMLQESQKNNRENVTPVVREFLDNYDILCHESPHFRIFRYIEPRDKDLMASLPVIAIKSDIQDSLCEKAIQYLREHSYIDGIITYISTVNKVVQFINTRVDKKRYLSMSYLSFCDEMERTCQVTLARELRAKVPKLLEFFHALKESNYELLLPGREGECGTAILVPSIPEAKDILTSDFFPHKNVKATEGMERNLFAYVTALRCVETYNNIINAFNTLINNQKTCNILKVTTQMLDFQCVNDVQMSELNLGETIRQSIYRDENNNNLIDPRMFECFLNVVLEHNKMLIKENSIMDNVKALEDNFYFAYGYVYELFQDECTTDVQKLVEELSVPEQVCLFEAAQDVMMLLQKHGLKEEDKFMCVRDFINIAEQILPRPFERVTTILSRVQVGVYPSFYEKVAELCSEKFVEAKSASFVNRFEYDLEGAYKGIVSREERKAEACALIHLLKEVLINEYIRLRSECFTVAEPTGDHTNSLDAYLFSQNPIDIVYYDYEETHRDSMPIRQVLYAHQANIYQVMDIRQRLIALLKEDN